VKYVLSIYKAPSWLTSVSAGRNVRALDEVQNVKYYLTNPVKTNMRWSTKLAHAHATDNRKDWAKFKGESHTHYVQGGVIEEVTDIEIFEAKLANK